MNHVTWNELVVGRWAGTDRPAIVDDDGVVTGQSMLERAAGAAHWFDRDGFRAGDAVPVLMDESRTSIAMLVGGAMTGRPIAPLGTKLSVEDLTAALRGLGARRMYVSPDRRDLAERVASQCGIEPVIVDAEPDPRPALPGLVGENDVALIVHTSGTTGHPKPVFLRQAALARRVEVYGRAMAIGPGDRYCSASPFYHTASVAMDATVLGLGASIIPQDWFSVENWRRAGRLGVTCALLVPTMIEMLLEQGALGDAAPRLLQYGAMPIHPDTVRAALAALPSTRFLQIFGQTEVSPISSLSHEDHLRAIDGRPELLRSVGRVVPGSDLTIEAPDADGIGEVTIRAGHAFQVDDDGWRRTGDLGRLDGEGYLFLHGRANDMIIRGGENIYPVEIEQALRGHRSVRDAAVVGIPDRRYGEIVKAVIVPGDPADRPEPAELGAFLAERVAHFKLPATYEFRSELPRNPAGKVLRRLLLEPADRTVGPSI